MNMRHFYTTLLIVLIGSAISHKINAQQIYELFVGEPEYLETPDAPFGGWIEFANWSRSGYVTLDEGDDYGAIIHISHYFEGTETVTCSYGYGYYSGTRKVAGHSSKSYFIKCNPIPFSLEQENIELHVGKQYTLKASYPSKYAGWVKTSDYKWESSDEYIAEVSPNAVNNGIVKALHPGNCTITFDPVYGPSVRCAVKVITDPPTGIKVKPQSLTIVEGQKASFSYELTPSNATTTVTWTSSAENIAKVNNQGVVTAISEGKAVITAKTDNGFSATGTVYVNPLPKKVSIDNNSRVPIGYGVYLLPRLEPTNSMTQFSWSSSDPSIAVIDKTGRLIGKKNGTVTITVTTSNNLSAQCIVTVYEPDNGLDYRNVRNKLQLLRSLQSKIQGKN